MAETLDETIARLTAFINQNYTDIETGPGSVISELLIKLAALLQNEQYNAISALSQGESIKTVTESSTDTYSAIMDQIASNYNTSRNAGSKAVGKIKVVVSEEHSYSFRAGFEFVQSALNLTYKLTENVRVSPTPSAALNEIQLFEEQGLYYFIVNAVAAKPGAEYQVTNGTVFSPASANSVTNFVKAEAYGGFSGGKAIETDKELVAKIKANLGNTRFDSASGIANNYRENFTNFQSLSLCGANDDEMVRSKKNFLGISTFGMADVYVRSSLGPQVQRLSKTGTKIAKDTWRIEINNTDAPGFYSIRAILPKVTDISLGGTLVPTGIDFGYALYPGQRNNQIPDESAARFTKYQTASVTFSYQETPTKDIGATADFEVHVDGQPDISKMQDMLLLDDSRLACADYLVKAVIPCMVSLDIKIVKKYNTDTAESLNIQQLKKDIFNYVNSIPFGKELQASNLIDICHNYNIKRVDLPIDMRGIILCPDGSSISISNEDVLTIPTRLDKGITPKTVNYFIDFYRITELGVNPIDNIGIHLY